MTHTAPRSEADTPTQPDTTPFSPLLSVIAIGVLWGLNWPAVKFLLVEMPPLTIRAIAFPIATLVLAVLAVAHKKRLMPARDEVWPIVGTGLCLIFGFNVLTTFGQMLTETSQAVIIAYTMPGLTAGLAVVILKERIRTRQVIALVLSFAGLATLAAQDWAGLIAHPAGPLVMFGAAFSWALGNVALKSRQWRLAPLALTVWFFAISSVLCIGLAMVFEPWHEQKWPSPATVWVLGYHILGPMVTCYALWTMLVGRLPASVAAITALLAPVVGVVSAVLILHEPVTWHKAVALCLILASIVLVLVPQRAKASAQAQH